MQSINHHDENSTSPLQHLFDRLPGEAAVQDHDARGADVAPRLRRTSRRLEVRSARSSLRARLASRCGVRGAPHHGPGCLCSHGRDELEAVGLELDELEDDVEDDDVEDDLEAVEQ